MTIQGRSDNTIAQDFVEALIESPPVNESEMRSRLALCDSLHVRHVLLDKIASGNFATNDSELLAAAFGVLGLGDCREAVKSIWVDPETSKLAKCTMMNAVAQAESHEFMVQMLEELPEQFMPALMADYFAHTIEQIVTDEAQGAETIIGVLESVPDSGRQSAFEFIDTIRQRTGTIATDLYAQAVRHASLKSVHERMIATIVEEGGARSVELLTQLRDTTRDPARRRALQKALLRAGTANAEHAGAPKEPQKGDVYVGSCDGQGAYVILALYQRRLATSSTLVDLCIRASEDIRDGFTSPRQRRSDLKEALERLGKDDSICFVRVPWSEAAKLVVDAVARTRDAGKEIPTDARSAVNLFERVAASEGVDQGSSSGVRVDATAETSIEAVRDLLDQSLYDYWFFDAGDLDGVGVRSSPGLLQSREKWIAQARAKLNTPTIRRRLVGMAQHMALWHHYNGDVAHASTMAAVVRATEVDVAQSPLLLVMLEKTIAMSRGLSRLSRKPPPVAPGGFGWDPGTADHITRRAIKQDYFTDLSRATGADLSQVDFCEISYGALDRHVHGLPGDRRPRPTEFLVLAMGIARAYLPHAKRLVGGSSSSPGDYAPEDVANDIVTAMVRTSSLSANDAAVIAGPLVGDLKGFAQTYCATCRHACLIRPTADASRAFYSSEHPYASRDDVTGGCDDPSTVRHGHREETSRATKGGGPKNASIKKERKRRKESRKRNRR